LKDIDEDKEEDNETDEKKDEEEQQNEIDIDDFGDSETKQLLMENKIYSELFKDCIFLDISRSC